MVTSHNTVLPGVEELLFDPECMFSPGINKLKSLFVHYLELQTDSLFGLSTLSCYLSKEITVKYLRRNRVMHTN